MVRTVDEVLDRMRAIDAGLPRRDGVAVFNRVYLQVTESVRHGLRDGFFRDARFMQQSDVVFAGSFHRVRRAWRELAARRPA
jgi:hypothetical protein